MLQLLDMFGSIFLVDIHDSFHQRYSRLEIKNDFIIFFENKCFVRMHECYIYDIVVAIEKFRL